MAFRTLSDQQPAPIESCILPDETIPADPEASATSYRYSPSLSGIQRCRMLLANGDVVPLADFLCELAQHSTETFLGFIRRFFPTNDREFLSFLETLLCRLRDRGANTAVLEILKSNLLEFYANISPLGEDELRECPNAIAAGMSVSSNFLNC